MEAAAKKPFLIHLSIVIGLCIVLFAGFFAALHMITGHGKETRMPSVKGQDIAAAIKLLKSLHFEINVDSTYDPQLAPLVVLKQMPDSGMTVKPGRTVVLTVNMLKPSKIMMPDLVGLPFGSAKMLLRTNKLILGDTSYKQDNNSKGIVLEQTSGGAPAWAGKMIQQGSRINLVMSAGAGKTEHNMPDVYGQTLDIALTVLAQYNLEVAVISKSNAVIDTNVATVIDQDPKDADENGNFNKIKSGTKVLLTVE